MSTFRSSGPAFGRQQGDDRADVHGARLGISLSGGGIRSATFALGVCQRLIEAGQMQRARFLSAVSGGSYLAAGLAISQATTPKELRDRQPPPWGRHSPEEKALRSNLTYLAPGVSGRLWLFANLAYGMILNLTPLVVGAYLCGRIVGLALRLLYPGLGSDGAVSLAMLPWVLVLAVSLAAAAMLVVGWRRFLDKDRFRRFLRKCSGEQTVTRLLALAGLVTALGVLLPLVLMLLNEVSGGKANLGIYGSIISLRRALVGLAAVFVSVGLGGIAVWLLRSRRLKLLRSVFAYLAGAGILFVPFLLATQTAAVRGFAPSTDVPLFIGSLSIMLLFAILVHNRRYSMHLFYRERLQDAFAFCRVERDGELDVEKIPYDKPILLSDVAAENARQREAGRSFPELVICAAVAARGAEVPNKTWAASFTFEGEMSGNESLNSKTRDDETRVLQAPTEQFETGDWIGGGNVTLPAMMAISGAAISPLMGRFTLPGFRFLLAMLNVRLGVWLRNPISLDSKLDPGKISRLGRAWRYVARGWREPGALYVLKEGLGLATASGRYIYVSDGGHWENLGLTELLRRGCTEIVVIDSSGGGGLGDIGRAMAVARAELNVEFELDLNETMPGEAGLAKTPVVSGVFEYPDGREGTIYYARPVLWEGAPADLRIFAEREQRFPNHPTSNQFFSGELFDAYRALGWAVGKRVVQALELLPPEDWGRRRADQRTGETT